MNIELTNDNGCLAQETMIDAMSLISIKLFFMTFLLLSHDAHELETFTQKKNSNNILMCGVSTDVCACNGNFLCFPFRELLINFLFNFLK